MRYISTFYSVIKNTQYNLEIVTNGAAGGTPVDISLGPDPFTTSMDTGSNTIYSPIKSQSATVQIAADTSTNSYYFDMYASTPKQNSVKLMDASNNIVWTGYMSPNVFDADYNFVNEVWDIEAVDGLSVLKNYDYVPADSSNGVPVKGFIPFNILIHNCLFKCGCYTKFYMSKALQIVDSSNNIQTSLRTIENLVISEQNFFNEDDEPMKYFDVLSECCKFLGVTCVAYGDAVYFMDYDAIKAGTPKYDIYTIGNAMKITTASYTPTSANRNKTVSSAHTIDASTYSSTGTRLSLESVYSKVTVKDSLYKVGSIIPSLYEDEDLRNVHYISENNQQWGYGDTKSCFHEGDSKKKTDDDTYFQWKWRYYTNKNYIHNYYDNSTGNLTYEWDKDKSSAYIPFQFPSTSGGALGAAVTKYIIGSGNTYNAACNGVDFDSWDNYLMITCNYSTASEVGPILQTLPTFSKPFFMSGKTKIIAKGDMILTDRMTFPAITSPHNDSCIGYWPHTGTYVSEYNGTRWRGGTLMITQNLVALKAKVDIGSVTKTEDIPFYPVDEGTKQLNENKKKHEIFYTNFGVQDNVTYEDRIKDKGYKIDMNINSKTVIPAKPIVSIYGLDNLRLIFNGMGWPSPLACVFIKDFDIVAVDPYEGPDDEVNSTDTEYTVEINDEYTTELSPIQFKFCTADGKSLNYSSVAWKDGNSNYQFVDKLNHTALQSKWVAAGSEDNYIRSEQIMCFKLVQQYESPCKKLTINMFDDLIKPYSLVTEPLLGADFIVDTFSRDFAADTITCNLIEKV